MGTQNTEDEEFRNLRNSFSFSDWNSLLHVDIKYTATENSDSPMSVFGYPRTPGASIPPAQSQFNVYPDPNPDPPFLLNGRLVDLDEGILQWRNNSTQPPIRYEGTSYYSTHQQFDNWYGAYKPERSGIEQSPIAEESDSKRKLEVKPDTKRASKKPRTPISRHDLEPHLGKTRKVAASCLKISVSKLKRTARECGISRWPCNRKSKGNTNLVVDPKTPNSDLNAPIAKTEKKKGVGRFMIVKVKYKGNFVKFELSSLSKIADLHEEVSKRLQLDDGSFEIKYMDEDEDWVSLPCDDDLEYCMRSAGETTIKMLVLPVTTR